MFLRSAAQAGNFHHRSVKRLALEPDLRLALKRRQFEVHYRAGMALLSGMPVPRSPSPTWDRAATGVDRCRQRSSGLGGARRSRAV
jgi:hypothetical protein